MPRFGSSKGVEVAAYDLGGDGPPLFFSHATGFHGHVWEPLAGELSGRFHGYAFDQRGHGDSLPPEDGDFDWLGLADDVLASLDGFGLERPFAVGHSSGGAALLLAEEKRPGTFRALYCYEPIVLPFDPPVEPASNPLAEGALKRRDVFPSRDAAFENFAAKPPLDVLRHDALRSYVEWGFADTDDGQVRLKCRPENESAMYRMSFAHRAFARFGEIECPVTLACGELTDAFGPAFIAQLAEPLHRVRTDVLPGLGHFGPLQDPTAVAASIVRAFAD